MVTPREVVRQDQDEPPPFSAALLDRVRDVDGVEAAAGAVFAVVRLVDDENEGLGAGFAPNFISSTRAEAVRPADLHRGPRAPDAAPRPRSTAAPPSATASKIGDRIGVAGDRSVERYRLVGRERDRRHLVRRRRPRPR